MLCAHSRGGRADGGRCHRRDLAGPLDRPSLTLPGHTADHVGSAVSVTQMNGNPQVYYTDATAHSLRHAWWTSAGWHFETLDGPGSTLPGRTGNQVGVSVAVTDY